VAKGAVEGEQRQTVQIGKARMFFRKWADSKQVGIDEPSHLGAFRSLANGLPLAKVRYELKLDKKAE
jgi:hypothetical protein